MVDHVERDLGRGAVVILVFEVVADEVIRRHEQLQIATVEQTVVDLLANDSLESPRLILLVEKHFLGVLCTIVIETSAETSFETTHPGWLLLLLLLVLRIVLILKDSLTLLVEPN